MSHFPSRNWIYCGIIRMHDYKTCEISLLQGSNLSVRSSSKTMFLLQEDLVHSSKETRTTKNSSSIRPLKSSLLGKIYAWSFSQTKTFHGPIELPSPVPPSLTAFCRTSKPSKNSFRTSCLAVRWSLVPLPQKTMGSSSYGA